MDAVLPSLIALARFHQLPANAEQLAHELGQLDQKFFNIAPFQAANALLLQTKALKPSLIGIKDLILPVIGKFSVVGFQPHKTKVQVGCSGLVWLYMVAAIGVRRVKGEVILKSFSRASSFAGC